MAFINSILCTVFDALLYPLRGFPPLVGLTVVSLVTAIGMLLVFKATSNQDGLAAVKKKIHACLFEIRLFNDDLRAILRAQMELLRHNLTYMRFSLVPLAWMIVPFVLLVAQLQFHYGYHGLQPGESALVKVALDDSWQDGVPVQQAEGGFTKPVARLEAPEGVTVESPALWAPAQSELDWRIRGDRPGDYELTLHLGEQTVTKRVHVRGDTTIRRMSPVRPDAGFLDQVLYPAEPPLPDGPVHRITITYEDADVWFLGWNTHWIIVFFILSIVFAFALRNRFGVTI
ncbi:MAG: hypothetical protein PVG07_02715 [Acidobacteriota bacterium]|jgi:uncharacterized membrane protein (DUF106 family)